MASSFLTKLRQQHRIGTEQQRLYYLLTPEGHQLKIQLVVARPQPDGRLDSVQSYGIQPSHLSRPPHFVSETDLGILRELHRVQEEGEAFSPHSAMGHHNPSYLTNEHLSGQWLDSLVRTGRALENQGQHVIRMREAFSLHLCWRISDTGEQRLGWEEEDQFQLIMLESPFYWHRREAACGPIRYPSSVALLRWLSQSPAFSDEEKDDFMARHRGFMETHDVPMPHRMESRDIRNAPVPRLKLSCDRHSGPPSCRIELQFDYSHHPLSVVLDRGESRTILPIYEDQTLWRIHRRLESEHDYRRQLARELEQDGVEWRQDDWADPADRRKWRKFMVESLPALRAQGWAVRIDEGFPFWFVRPEKIEAVLRQQQAHWFDLGLYIEIDGRPFPMLPLLREAQKRYTLQEVRQMPAARLLEFGLDDGRTVLVEARRVALWLSVLVEMANQPEDTESLSLPISQLARLNALQEDEALAWHDPESLLEQAGAVEETPSLSKVRLPEWFQASLRAYQTMGVAWLQQRARLNVGGILADDMGLGKTLQTLAHIVQEKEEGRLNRPVLILAPSSVTHNWMREADRFAPRLNCLLMHGASRHQSWPKVCHQDVVVTSYHTAFMDLEYWQQQPIQAVFMDEAQMMKNSQAKMTKALKKLAADYKICLTGTPMENHLGELWSLLDFVMPGLLDSRKQFDQCYRRPIEREGNEALAQALMRRIAPFMLRRTKQDVAPELPEKNEIVVRLPLEQSQRDYYEALRLDAVHQLNGVLPEKQENQGRVMILNALMKLRRACCDPALIKGQDEQQAGSAKRAYLIDMVMELVEEGRSLIVFSQFTGMLDLIAVDLKERQIDYLLLTGKSRGREGMVERFQAGEVPVFLISLKAGGTGLNLTQADTVIHYDPWWNSSAEQQATDRAHRIGQDKPVFVYKLLTEDTIEEKIFALQRHKQSLLEQVYQAAEGNSRQLALDNEALLSLLE